MLQDSDKPRLSKRQAPLGSQETVKVVSKSHSTKTQPNGRGSARIPFTIFEDAPTPSAKPVVKASADDAENVRPPPTETRDRQRKREKPAPLSSVKSFEVTKKKAQLVEEETFRGMTKGNALFYVRPIAI